MAGVFSYFTGPDVSKEQDVIDATKKRDDAKAALATAETNLTDVTKNAKERVKKAADAKAAEEEAAKKAAEAAKSGQQSGTVEGSSLPSNSGGRRRKHKGGKHTKKHRGSKRARTGRKSSRL